MHDRSPLLQPLKPAAGFLCSRAPWSGAEDGALGGLVARHGSQWSRISRAFRGRTAQQCRARWGSGFWVQTSGSV
jgi:Myb-like DNA-binding domain